MLAPGTRLTGASRTAQQGRPCWGRGRGDREESVEDIFALGPTNSSYAEYELDQVDRAGKHYHVTGVTAFHATRGKIRHAKDCIFDQDGEATAYPPKDTAVALPNA